MRFGLVVTDERYRDQAVSILATAQGRGWECRCFLNDRGALLLMDNGFTQSDAFRATQVAVCELSVERYENEGLKVSSIDEHVVIGGQYQDAELVQNSDCVLVL
ncbi:hypothetical protein TspCOW1_27150 [Thiohalobacter sp. COW1]|uniref:Sulfur reduction protein DsrE n=1 Tax=Thiohalobacter thiocyanaticus TaxID=585455 RepID=A0A1Z4VLM2_9GAMM|nr:MULTISPECIES: hypothetical protein [Thiohalobacter]BAZ92413.1 uncharacterized protein FOKN1_0008 [Thiohalobacter thiocyanaticus]BCO32612.1 hypothetical protein TspCOW1_27150 [Thiohalobacter sp. COW1]